MAFIARPGMVTAAMACMPISRAERLPQLKSDFYKEDIGMKPHKKNLELMRSLIDWIISSEITGDVYESALYTILSLIHI